MGLIRFFSLFPNQDSVFFSRDEALVCDHEREFLYPFRNQPTAAKAAKFLLHHIEDGEKEDVGGNGNSGIRFQKKFLILVLFFFDLIEKNMKKRSP